MRTQLAKLAALAGSVARLGAGTFVRRGGRTPERMLELYDFEACPFCRRVREALTELDLDVLVYPCPQGGMVFRPRAAELGGTRFPLLVDPNTGQVQDQSRRIIRYLFAEYGPGGQPVRNAVAQLDLLSSQAASLTRPLRGLRARPSQRPDEPLVLYGFEASPFCRLVRETLCELELPYVQRNLAKGAVVDFLPPALRQRLAADTPHSTEKRRAMAADVGKVMLPYLLDPNTGIEMFESVEIISYLEDTYAR